MISLPTEATTWSEYENVIAGLIGATFSTNATFVFRGDDAEHDKLIPSIARHSRGFDFEDHLLQRFRQQAHLFADRNVLPHPHERFEWWALMQHYGVPTRLLDWSVSPYVAAYFACRDESALKDKDSSTSSKDGVVTIAYIPRVLRQNTPDLDADAPYASDGHPMIAFREPLRASQRSSLQRGWFSVVTGKEPSWCHREALRRVPVPDDGFAGATCNEITIPAGAKIEFLRQLHYRGITAQALFPGLEGLGRRLRDDWLIDCHERSTTGGQ